MLKPLALVFITLSILMVSISYKHTRNSKWARSAIDFFIINMIKNTKEFFVTFIVFKLFILL